jgi:Sulfotransferase family
MHHMDKQEPIIVIGMHRSGTSMITRMLEQLGLFMGKDKDGNDEAKFFLKLNDWLLGKAGGAWDNPEIFHYLLNDKPVRALTLDYLDFSLSSPSTLSFLGFQAYWQYRSPKNLTIPWGWKDPRNTFTLPLWLDLFPQAKVIHIYRHGIDVASSLYVRREKIIKTVEKNYKYRKLMRFVGPGNDNFIPSVRCSSLEGGFSLWESYLEEAQRHVKSLGGRALEFRYEDFLLNPPHYLKELAQFCDLEADDTTIQTVAAQAEVSRAKAFQNSPELTAFSQRVLERLQRYGYEG